MSESSNPTSSPQKKSKDRKSSKGPDLQSLPKSEALEGRSIPNASEAERMVLSSMIQSPVDRIGEAVEAGFHASYFYLPAHRLLFELLLELTNTGQPVDLVLLHQLLEDRKQLDFVGGASSLVSLSTAASSDANFRYYLEVIRDKSILRSIIESSSKSIDEAYENPPEVGAFLDRVETDIFSIKESLTVKKDPDMSDLIQEVMDTFETLASGQRGLEGIPTGYKLLNEMSNGLKPGEMMIIAARPSMGKTSFMMNMVEEIGVNQKVPTLVFSCEMTAQQIVQRLLFSRAKFALSNMKPGFKIQREELERIQKASAELKEAPLFIDDTPSLPIGDLRAKARRLKREKGIGLIAVDYLQLMRSNSKQSSDSREREVAEISSGLKAIAKELGVPVIVLAQLNRGPEQRGGTPRMSDLRESGSIEQDADMIGLLFRKEYYNDPTKEDAEEEREANEGHAQLILAKNRNGPTGTIPLHFTKELMLFAEREFTEEELAEG